MLIGYMRPYHGDIDCKKQREVLTQASCEIIFTEKHSFAHERIALESGLDCLSKGDTLVVTRLFSFADSVHHLEELLDEIERKGGFFRSLFENIDTNSQFTYHFSDIVLHLAHFQSDVISEKTKNGLDEAKKKGIETGRPRKSDEKIQAAISMYHSKRYSFTQIKDETGISKSTLYRYLES